MNCIYLIIPDSEIVIFLVCLHLYIHVCLFVHLSVCLSCFSSSLFSFFSPPLGLSLSVCPSVCFVCLLPILQSLYISLSVCFSIYLFVCLSLSFKVYFSLSVFHFSQCLVLFSISISLSHTHFLPVFYALFLSICLSPLLSYVYLLYIPRSPRNFPPKVSASSVKLIIQILYILLNIITLNLDPTRSATATPLQIHMTILTYFRLFFNRPPARGRQMTRLSN